MRSATAAGIPAPQIYHTGRWQDHAVLLLSWVPGQTLASQLQNHPWQVWRLGVAFGQLQAALHAAPHNSNRDDWIEWAGPQEQLLKDRLYTLEPRGSALLHLDYHLLNVMTDGTRITGVLDWANARAGDPRADFARTYAILHVEPWSPDAPSLPFRLLRWMLGRAWQYGYRRAAGKLEDMALFHAWAGAVMIRDLSPRIGQAGSWLEPRHFEPIRRWTALWRARAGLPAE